MKINKFRLKSLVLKSKNLKKNMQELIEFIYYYNKADDDQKAAIYKFYTLILMNIIKSAIRHPELLKQNSITIIRNIPVEQGGTFKGVEKAVIVLEERTARNLKFLVSKYIHFSTYDTYFDTKIVFQNVFEYYMDLIYLENIISFRKRVLPKLKKFLKSFEEEDFFNLKEAYRHFSDKQHNPRLLSELKLRPHKKEKLEKISRNELIERTFYSYLEALTGFKTLKKVEKITKKKPSTFREVKWKTDFSDITKEKLGDIKKREALKIPHEVPKSIVLSNPKLQMANAIMRLQERGCIDKWIKMFDYPAPKKNSALYLAYEANKMEDGWCWYSNIAKNRNGVPDGMRFGPTLSFNVYARNMVVRLAEDEKGKLKRQLKIIKTR